MRRKVLLKLWGKAEGTDARRYHQWGIYTYVTI